MLGLGEACSLLSAVLVKKCFKVILFLTPRLQPRYKLLTFQLFIEARAYLKKMTIGQKMFSDLDQCKENKFILIFKREITKRQRVTIHVPLGDIPGVFTGVQVTSFLTGWGFL